MSRENVESIRRGFELWSRIVRGEGDEETVAEMLAGYAPDARIDFSATAFEMPPDAGVEDMVAWIFEATAGSMEDVRIERGELRASGDDVVMPVRMEGRGRESGVPVTMTFAYVFRFAHGKVVFAKTFATEAEALAFAGLAE